MTPLHLIDTLGIGRAEQMLVNLLPALATLGCKPKVAVLRAPYDLEEALAVKGISVTKEQDSGNKKNQLCSIL